MGLQRACERGDVAAARRGLLAWLREFGPEPADGSLLEFAVRSGDPALQRKVSTRWIPRASGDTGARDSAGPAGRDLERPGILGPVRSLARVPGERAGESRNRRLTDLYAPANRAP